MGLTNTQSKTLAAREDVGILFVGPIIGLPPSLISAFDVFKERGIGIEGVDIFEGQNIKKNLSTILGLTILPGSQKRRIEFANNYNERHLFEVILNKISSLKARGKKRIIIGGMSGGFIFASRMVQVPPDRDAASYALKAKPFISGLFGISPLIFYPSGVFQKGADLESIPSHVPTTLIWGDADTIVPKGTIAYGQRISQKKVHVKCRVIRGSEAGSKDGKLKHQFFGGKDFIKPLTNVYWNPKAEGIALEEITNIVKTIL